MENSTPTMVINGGTVNITINNDKNAVDILNNKMYAERRSHDAKMEMAKNIIDATAKITEQFVKSRTATPKPAPKKRK